MNEVKFFQDRRLYKLWVNKTKNIKVTNVFIDYDKTIVVTYEKLGGN